MLPPADPPPNGLTRSLRPRPEARHHGGANGRMDHRRAARPVPRVGGLSGQAHRVCRLRTHAEKPAAGGPPERTTLPPRGIEATHRRAQAFLQPGAPRARPPAGAMTPDAPEPSTLPCARSGE